MKTIRVSVDDAVFEALKAAAERAGLPIADVIREAMVAWMAGQPGPGHSILDVEVHDSGAMREGWTRSGVLDEMRDCTTFVGDPR